MIPILYAENETNFNHNGIGQLHEVIGYEVTEVRNGEFELMLEYPVSGQWFKEISDMRLILADPNDTDDPHLFRIYEITKVLSTASVLIYAGSITNDLGGNMVRSVTISGETGQQAMNKLKASLIEPTNFNFVSDIQTETSTKWENRNALNCIAGEQGSLIQYWGGEIKRTNDTIYLYSRRGTDNVSTIRPGKNLRGFEMTVSTKGLITAILPFFKMIPDDGSTEQVTITGDVVYSPLAGNYPISKITPVDYSGNESVTTLEELNAKALVYFEETNPGSDKPKVKLNIDMMELADSEEYSQFKDLEKIHLTDTVTVWVEKFDVDVVVKVTEVVYDGMARRIKKLTAGTPSVTFYDSVRNTYQEDINYLKDYADTIVNGVRNQIQLTADSKNTIFRGYTEPPSDISKKDDLWYKDLGSGNVAMLQFDGSDWLDLKITDDVFADEMSVTKFTAGTLNAALVNLINLNASNITTGTLTGINFWVNLLTGLMRFIDPDTQDTLDLDQAKIIFGAGTNYERILAYTSEGWKLYPGPNNTGTNLNTSLRLHGGITYVDFIPDVTGDIDETMARARIESNGQYLYLRTANGKAVSVVDWAGAPRPIKVGSITIDNATLPTYLWANHWETPRDGDRDMIISPNGAARLKVCTPEENAFYPVWASNFVVSSSEKYKKNVKKFELSGLDLVNGVEIIEYDLLEADGEELKVNKERRKDIGMIAEKSLPFTNQNGKDDDGTMIDLYRTVSIQMKAIQELSAKNDEFEKRLSVLENKNRNRGVV